MTAWACIGLLEAKYPDRSAIERGLKLIIEGVFNKSCMISYPNYKFVFPMKALGKFAQRYGDVELL
jgi:lanosterol synthase